MSLFPQSNNCIYLPYLNYSNINLAFLLQDLFKEFNYATSFQSTVIKGLYGSFSGALWNGGRTLPIMEQLPLSEIEKQINILNLNNIKFKATFTNLLLNEEHLKDEYCNNILQILNNGFNNEIVVANPILENYLLDKYPSLPLISSITKGNDFNTFYTALNSNRYSQVVAYPKQNILDYISTLATEKKEQIELLLGSGCGNCPMAKQHYLIESFNNLYNQKETFSCYRDHANYNISQAENQIPLSDKIIYNVPLYQDLGIRHYKITGRNVPIEILTNDLINLLFLPEYQNEIKIILNNYIDFNKKI